MGSMSGEDETAMIDTQARAMSATWGEMASVERGGMAPASTDTEEMAVSLRGLTKRFGGLRAVDDLTLEIRRGETVALLGPNGAGKSTTVSMLLGLLTPDSGTINVLGMTPGAAIQRGRVGAMLQDGALMPGVRVGELLDYALSLSASALTRKRLVALAGLEGLERRRLDRLSGGQIQRARFALAIASEPDVLALDEPTAALDVEGRRDFWANMREYTSAGRAVLFATHYLEEAEAFASRVVIIARGRIVADGTVAGLKRDFGVHTIRFTCADENTSALERLPGVSHVEHRDATVTLRTTDSDATVRSLLASDVGWRDLEVQSATLDDIFVTLVDKQGQGGK
jgi:ABC-2 type transport system ATP-binding protein